MTPPTRPFVGRDRELAELVAALEESHAGSGSLWLLAGEPGIGKSRLTEEVARHAATRGFVPLSGRCWESGGAPTYWPWVQVLRGLLRHVGAGEVCDRLGSRAPHLLALLPELALARPDIPAAPPLDADQARFQVLEAATALLVESAAREPLLMVLEDLHAADASSLLLLEFLERELAQARILVLGTYRDAELEAAPAAPYLARVARSARHLHLGRLDRAQVTALLAQMRERDTRGDLATAVHATTDGNPLFVVEMARLLASDDGEAIGLAGRGGLPIPPTIRAALRERLARLDPETHEVLEGASVLGREFSGSALAELLGRSELALAAPLGRAVEAALIGRAAPECHRFTHMLTREVLHDDLPDERRWALHARRAEALTRAPVGGGTTAWSEVAHHWLAAGPEARHQALSALMRAAEQASARVALDDAALILERALRCLDAIGADDPARRMELELALGRARNLAGDAAGARSACATAIDIARRTGDAELLARAALEYGAGYVYGSVEAKLTELLEEALGALPASDGALRARLMARLAAALQPATEPEHPLGLARDAVAMARRVGEARTLLLTLRDAGSAFMDMAHPVERTTLSHEHVALAERLGEPVDAWRGSLRLVFDYLETSDLPGARAAIDSAARHAEVLAHPHYRWPVVGIRAMCAVREGRFAEARRLLAEARALADAARDPNGHRALLVHELCRLRLEGRRDEERALLPELSRSVSGIGYSEMMVRIWAAALGLDAPVSGALASADVDVALVLADTSLLQHLIDIADRRRDTKLADALAERFAVRADRNVRWGLFGVMVEGPMTQLLGRVAMLRGRVDEARSLFEEALASARATGARPHAAWIAYDLGRALSAGDGPTDRDRGRALFELAHAEATELDMPGLVVDSRLALDALAERVGPSLDQDTMGAPDGSKVATDLSRPNEAPRPELVAPRFQMALEGELWAIERDARRFHVRDTKGLRMLAALVSRPGYDWHVLDLSSPQRAGALAQGDSGEMLDARARAEYREQVAALRRDIEQAEDWNDAARAERARAELESLTAELTRATGLGGRSRRQGADAERARVNVQRRVRDAIRRIGELDSALARHLERSIRTGTTCRYDPE